MRHWQGGWLPGTIIIYYDPDPRWGWVGGHGGRRGSSLLLAQVAEGPRLAWSQGRRVSAPLPAARALPLPLRPLSGSRSPGAVQAPDAAHRPWLVALARSPATIATPAAASRAMNLPRGLLVAWTLSLWPGTFPPSPPFASGSSLVLQDLCSSCEEKDETRLPWHYLRTQVCGNPLQLNCPAKIAKEGIVPRKVFLELWCVWDKKKLLELLEQLSTLGAPRCSCGNKFPRVHRATRASLHCQGPRPQLGKGTDRAERV